MTTVLAGILIFCCVLGLMPERAFLFCFTNLPKLVVEAMDSTVQVKNPVAKIEFPLGS